MKIYETSDIGKLVKKKRRELNLSQTQLADMNGSGTRFISDLENVKPTMQIGKIIETLLVLGLDLSVVDRGNES